MTKEQLINEIDKILEVHDNIITKSSKKLLRKIKKELKENLE